jgi:hypothetical protein
VALVRLRISDIGNVAEALAAHGAARELLERQLDGSALLGSPDALTL